MKSINVHVGDVYAVRVSGVLANVRIDAVHPSGGWVGRNVKTGRTIRFRTAARLRYNVTLKERAERYYEDVAAGNPTEPDPTSRPYVAGDLDGTAYAETKPEPRKRGWY